MGGGGDDHCSSIPWFLWYRYKFMICCMTSCISVSGGCPFTSYAVNNDGFSPKCRNNSNGHAKVLPTENGGGKS